MLLGAWPLGAKNSISHQKHNKFRFVFLIGGYAVFLILGASIFSSIEAPKIADIDRRIDAFRDEFLEKNHCLNDKKLLFEMWKVELGVKLKSKIKDVSSSITMDKKSRNQYEDLDKVSYINHNFLSGDCTDSKNDLKINENNNNSNNNNNNNNNNDKVSASTSAVGYKNNKTNIKPSKIINTLEIYNSTLERPMSLSSSVNISQSLPILPPLKSGKKYFSLKRNLLLLLFIICYGFYLVLGSLAFMTIETPIVNEIRKAIEIKKLDFRLRYPMINDADLEEFLAAVIKANDRGISPLRNVSNELNWGFGQSLFFSSTIVTTIGYGHVTPLSQTGKIFCIIYASFGIPLTLVLLTALIERLLIPANWLLGKLNSQLGHLYQPFNIRLLHLTIIVAIVSVLFVAIPTFIFSYLEPEWGTLDALYYCFITLTTIGLGDYIPGEGVDPENRSLYKICIAVYLISGLIAVMLCLTIFYDIPQLNLGQLFTENGTGETEKLRLSGNAAPCYSGPSGLYIPQQDEERRAVVRIRPHGGDESPSPTDDQSVSTMAQSDIRVP